jgi:hypothetical protein
MELTSDICKLAIRSHLEPGLITSWFWLGPFMALAFIREDHWVYRFLLRKFEYGTRAKFPEPQGSTKFPSSWNYEQIHEQSHELKPLQRTFHLKVLTGLESFSFILRTSYNSWKLRPHSSEITEQNASLGPFLFLLPNSWESHNLRRFEGERFLPNSPT